MAGMAILDSCHNCGSEGDLDVVNTSHGCGCGKVHVYVACPKCRRDIWGQ